MNLSEYPWECLVDESASRLGLLLLGIASLMVV
jgi:hypothetical protein